VEWIAYEQPPWKAKLIHAAYGLPLGRRLGWMMRDKKASRAFGATLAFECIGAEAEGAIPTLATMATNSARPVCATRAIHALGFIRSGASNVLRKIDTEALERGTR